MSMLVQLPTYEAIICRLHDSDVGEAADFGHMLRRGCCFRARVQLGSIGPLVLCHLYITTLGGVRLLLRVRARQPRPLAATAAVRTTCGCFVNSRRALYAGSVGLNEHMMM